MFPAEAVANNPWGAVAIFFAMLIAHATGDFALQSNFLSQAKNRHAELKQFYPEGKPRGMWWNALFAHSLIHAGVVWLVTGLAVLAFAELILHFLIDYTKCEERISFSMDQSLHRLCKLGYAVLLFLHWPDFIYWDPFGSI